jgi:hypothetical protein
VPDSPARLRIVVARELSSLAAVAADLAEQLLGQLVERQAGGLALRVPARDSDALLLTALRLGCSVREVRES